MATGDEDEIERKEKREIEKKNRYNTFVNKKVITKVVFFFAGIRMGEGVRGRGYVFRVFLFRNLEN